MKNQELSAEKILEADADAVINLNIDGGVVHICIQSKHFPPAVYDYEMTEAEKKLMEELDE